MLEVLFEAAFDFNFSMPAVIKRAWTDLKSEVKVFSSSLVMYLKVHMRCKAVATDDASPIEEGVSTKTCTPLSMCERVSFLAVSSRSSRRLLESAK